MAVGLGRRILYLHKGVTNDCLSASTPEVEQVVLRRGCRRFEYININISKCVCLCIYKVL